MPERSFATTYPSKRYPPLGKCLYCGTTEGRLTDEHVIPFALGGAFVLPKSSCDACADVTKNFEGFCMRPMMGSLRMRLQLQTRRKSERPKTIQSVLVGPDGAQEIIETLPEKYPLMALGFKWRSAGLMLGEPPSRQFEGELVVKHDTLGEFSKKFADRKVKLGAINQSAFARMLAKIAHAHAIAESTAIGLKLRPFLPEIILGKSDIYPYYIGGDTDPLVAEPYFHQLRFRQALFNGRKLYFVTIHLFGFMAMPRYHVVVGEE